MNTAPRIADKERFDDDIKNLTGRLIESYHGWNYTIVIQNQRFNVRIFDYAPTVATILDPISVKESPYARTLVDLILSDLSCTDIMAYGPRGGYQFVDSVSLEFR
jgi:hypothetical protein